MAVSVRIRFEVLKRDGFKCVYCGAGPAARPLEIDHVQPRSLGGTDSPANLVTACWPCNRGKRDHLMSGILPNDGASKAARTAAACEAELAREVTNAAILCRRILGMDASAWLMQVLILWVDTGDAGNIRPALWELRRWRRSQSPMPGNRLCAARLRELFVESEAKWIQYQRDCYGRRVAA